MHDLCVLQLFRLTRSFRGEIAEDTDRWHWSRWLLFSDLNAGLDTDKQGNALCYVVYIHELIDHPELHLHSPWGITCCWFQVKLSNAI